MVLSSSVLWSSLYYTFAFICSFPSWSMLGKLLLWTIMNNMTGNILTHACEWTHIFPLGICLCVELPSHGYPFLKWIVLESKDRMDWAIKSDYLWTPEWYWGKVNIVMGIHPRSWELTLPVPVSEGQDVESVLTGSCSTKLLSAQSSCHINFSSLNLESVMGSGLSSFCVLFQPRLLICPCAHLR